MRPLAAAIVLLGLLTAACGGGKAPYVSRTPTSAPVTPPAGTRACDPQELRSVLNTPGELAGPQVAASVALFNASESGCMLDGLPSVEVLDNQKNLLAADVFALCDEAYSGCPPQYPVLLVPSRTNARPLLAGASVALKWTAPAGSSPCASPLQAGFLEVSIPGGHVMVPVNPAADKAGNTIQLCGGRLGVGRFESISVDFDTLDKYAVAPGLPTPTPTPFIDHSVRPCLRDELHAIFGGPLGVNFSMSIGFVVLGNRSDSICRLEGTPGIALLDGSGNEVAATPVAGCPGSVLCKPLQSVLVLPHSDDIKPHEPAPGTAQVQLNWPEHFTEGPPCDPPTGMVTIVRLILPENGGTVDAPVTDAPYYISPCGTISVGWFESDSP